MPLLCVTVSKILKKKAEAKPWIMRQTKLQPLEN